MILGAFTIILCQGWLQQLTSSCRINVSYSSDAIHSFLIVQLLNSQKCHSFHKRLVHRSYACKHVSTYRKGNKSDNICGRILFPIIWWTNISLYAEPLFVAVVNKMQCSVGYFHLALAETVLQRLPKIKTPLKSKRTTVWKMAGLASWDYLFTESLFRELYSHNKIISNCP